MIFEWKHGLIWATLQLVYEGKSIKIDNCILDTGSATTAIDIDLVHFNYQKPATIKRLFGIGGGTHEVVTQKVVIFLKHGRTIGTRPAIERAGVGNSRPKRKKDIMSCHL